jgi:D-tyrosyl-tRNA(Tyr) deacylase
VRILAQRVSRASVTVGDDIVGKIGPGFLLLVGVTHDDVERDAETLARKVANLRVFDDEAGNLNLSLLEIATSDPTRANVLVVSQFTLYADSRKGRRPSFTRAAAPAVAEPLVECVARTLASLGLTVQRGRFGADMAVELVNDGPVTIWLDTAELHS